MRLFVKCSLCVLCECTLNEINISNGAELNQAAYVPIYLKILSLRIAVLGFYKSKDYVQRQRYNLSVSF